VNRRPPPITEALARRLDDVGVRFMLEWLRGVAARAGNPRRLELRNFGAVVAPASDACPELDFMNRVGGLTPADAEQVPSILAYYADRAIRPWFELVPCDGMKRLTAPLVAGGAAHEDWHSMLYGLPDAGGPASALPPGVAVDEIGPERMGDYARVRVEGHEIPGPHDDPIADLKHWGEVAQWRHYLATVDGVPAACATLAVDDGVGYLASAATLPAFRGRGLQSALAARRVADAVAAGCELVSSQASFGSTSHRNLQRAGLEVAFTKATWRVQANNEAAPGK